jgi:TetR/AcrR family transcriptional regulator, transcriptional repressor for nem operon
VSKGEQTRQRIVARAADVFNVRGFAGTSMGDLIHATGLEKGGIYNHFPSKEALALAAFDHAVEVIGRRFQEAMLRKERAIDRLTAIIGVFQSHLENPPLPGGCPVLNTAVEADDTYPALREHAQAAMTSWHKLIGKTVKVGVRRGELRPDADPYAVASIMTATLEGALMLSKLYDDPSHLRRAVAHLAEYLQSLALRPEE